MNAAENMSEDDYDLVTWDSEDDPANPRNWPTGKKSLILMMVLLYSLIGPFASSMMSPDAAAISEDFGITSSTVEALLISIFLLGLAVGPLFTAPLSELYGRARPMIVTCWIFTIFNLGCSLCNTTAQMCILRFLAGFAGSTPMTVGAGCIGDMYEAKQRNVAMGIYILGPTMGPVISPIITGFMIGDKSLNWRWPMYVLTIFSGSISLGGTILMRESYAPKILHDKAQRLIKETGNTKWHTVYEAADLETVAGKFYINLTRPFTFLFTNPIIFGFGLFMAIAFGCLYILVVCFPKVWTEIYGFSTGISGTLYVSMLIGYLLGNLVFTVATGKIYAYLTKKNNGIAKPEYRLPILTSASVLLPIALFWYGWAVEYKLQWIQPAIASTIFCFSVVGIFQTMTNYIVDMSPRFVASSMAAVSLFRFVLGFAFPLFIQNMIDSLGYGWAFSLFGFISLGVGLPFPFFIFYKGEVLRNWANKRAEESAAKRNEKIKARIRRKLQAAETAEGEDEKTVSVEV